MPHTTTAPPAALRIYLAGEITDVEYAETIDALTAAGVVFRLGDVRSRSEDPVADAEALASADLIVQAGAELDALAALVADGLATRLVTRADLRGGVLV